MENVRLFTKKPLAVAAMQFTAEPADKDYFERWTELWRFANHLIYVDHDNEDLSRLGSMFVFDYLHNTWVEFKRGDWIVKGVKGEFYPVEEAVFAETYEEYFEDRDSPV